MTPDLAQAVTDIAAELVQPGAGTSGADAFLGLFHAAKMHDGGAPRFGWRHSFTHPVSGRHVDEHL
jgi:hypothetical protein